MKPEPDDKMDDDDDDDHDDGTETDAAGGSHEEKDHKLVGYLCGGLGTVSGTRFNVCRCRPCHYKALLLSFHSLLLNCTNGDLKVGHRSPMRFKLLAPCQRLPALVCAFTLRYKGDLYVFAQNASCSE